MARSASTSLAALCVAIGAWTAWAGEAKQPPRPAPQPEVRVVGMVPAADAKVQAALARGIENALQEASTKPLRWRLQVSPAPKKWSNAGPATVRLIFRQGAKVLITPPDRRVSHLMAQVATRVQVPLITTSAAPTVATTGSNVLKKVATAKQSAPNWERVGYRAGRQATGATASSPR